MIKKNGGPDTSTPIQACLLLGISLFYLKIKTGFYKRAPCNGAGMVFQRSH